MTPDDKEHEAGHWDETRDSLKGIFGAKAAPRAETTEEKLEAEELETLEQESPSVSRSVEVADGEVEVPAEPTPPMTAPPAPTSSAEPAGESSAAPTPSEAQPAAESKSAGPKADEPEAASSSFQTGDLEEETYAPTLSAQGHKAGDEVSGYRLNEDLGRGWFTANPVGSGPSADVYAPPDPQADPLWAALLPHRLLPKATKTGDLYVLEPSGGLALRLPLGAGEAKAYLADLARLLFALEKQGYGVTDLDPASVQLAQNGLRLRLPPKVARLGGAAPPSLRDGFTPPEVQEGGPVQPQTGVYLLGALLYFWLTGHPLPPEGPSPITLAGVKASGVPQLLSAMLAPVAKRPSPSEVLALLKTYGTQLPVYTVAATTDIGLNPERPANEDSYGFSWRQLGQHGGGEVLLRACVSDGMGGMAAGEVASQAAVRGFLDSAAGTLENQIWDANAAVLQDMAGRDGGCTISAVELRGTQLQLGHVGDTRAYVSAGGQVEQISKDHSYVAAMVASGQMTPEEAQQSPERNKVLRSLGSLRVPQQGYVMTLPEPLELAVGNRVLLVSDGVWGEVPPDLLQEVLLHEPTPQGVADRLVALSLEAGAPDNVTALVIERVK